MDASEAAALQAQLDRERLDLAPMAQSPAQPFRTELDFERSPIFVCSKYTELWREYRRQFSDPKTGEDVDLLIRVGKKHPSDRPRGILTQAHQEVFYKLLTLWDRAGYPLLVPDDGTGADAMGHFRMSAYELVQFIYDGPVNGRRYRRLQTLLGDLCAIPIHREYNYPARGTRDIDAFTLLASADWVGRSLDQRTQVPTGAGRSDVHIVFSALITAGFLHKTIKPLLLGPYLELGSPNGRRAELARLLYPLLDYELSRKARYHCKLGALADRFGCANYPHRSKRREKFLPAVKALDGKPILSGEFSLRVTLEMASDGSDWMLVAWRDRQERLPLE